MQPESTTEKPWAGGSGRRTRGGAAGAVTVAIAGNPNSGKSTLFNALTGLRQKVANFPGVTVEMKLGRCVWGHGEKLESGGFAGLYSLQTRSPDEG
jgi:ferrous iron transport protein B